MDIRNCTIIIQIPDPTSEPLCTKRLGSNLLDFRELSGELRVPYDGNVFVFNVCGKANSCGLKQASSCLVRENGEVDILGHVNTQLITYDDQTGQVRVNYRVGSGRSEFFQYFTNLLDKLSFRSYACQKRMYSPNLISTETQ